MLYLNVKILISYLHKKNIMYKLFVILFSFVFIAPGFSQTYSVNHFGGINAKPSSSFEGDPFLFNTWKQGEVTLTTDQKFEVGKLNLDASRNVFLYESNDSTYEFTNNIKEVRVYGEDHANNPGSDMIFRTDVNPSAASFVQVFTKGKVIIFCEYSKKVGGENSNNGFVTTARQYELFSNYYSLIGNNATPIKFTSSTLDELTADKKTFVDAYVKANNLKVKKPDDFIKAITFYNSLKN